MRKYLRFVSQSVLGMLGLSVYILADTFFIANYIGADGLASLNLALPIYGIINGTGLLIGIGGGVRYTLRHTRGDENADSVFTASLLMGAVLSFIYVLCGVFGAEHLARLLGASGTVLQPTTVYLKVCCLFSPFFILNNILTTFTRNDDAPGRAMAAMLTGSFANIMMDWYMVCVLNAGMLGAVLATGMSPIFGVAICLTRKRGYHIGKHRIFEEIPKISAAGFSAFIGEFSSTVVILIFNYLLLSLAGSTGVAAYGIIANVALVATAVLTGAAQGVQPLISIAFAEHDRRTLTKQTRRGVVIIAREAKRLTGMVEELLEFTRMQDGRFTLHVETADVLAEFEDTVFMYGNRLKQEGICLHYDGCDEEIPEIPCDVARMRQVFLNILDNAAKHGGEGKRIDASIAHEGTSVVIRIRDYGPGIPEEELPRVKLKFYKGSSKARGSGIGLAVCEEIVTMHGGMLTLENAEGGGTLVTISIPTGEE